jgi:phenol 2-monooxygenase
MIVFTSNDLLDKSGVSQSSLQSCSEIVQRFPEGTIDLVFLHSLKTRFEWTDIPPSVKQLAEMRTYGLSRKEDAYEVYGVSKDEGLVAVVRPDGYVGMLAMLSSTEEVEEFLRSCLVRNPRYNAV